MLASVRQFLLTGRIWRFLPVVAGLCCLIVVAGIVRQSLLPGTSHRVIRTVPVAVLLAAAALGFYIAPKSTSRALPEDPAWRASLVVAAAVAMAGLVAVAFLELIPPPLERSAYKAWDYLDKRWLVASFLLASSVVYVPGLVRRALTASPVVAVLTPGWTGSRIWRRLAGAVLAGSVLAVVYVAPMLPGAAERRLDAHEQVHLGAFQRIAQGAVPYVDARTQYGPGHQIVSYALMRSGGFTLRGFRLSQAWLNLGAVAVLFSLWFFAFGAQLGAIVIAVSLALSPLLIVTFWGWGLLLRWMAPVLVGGLLPLLVWRAMRMRGRVAGTVLLGVACGGLAWMAQENLSGGITAAGLLLGAAVVRGAIPIRSALILGVSFAAAELTTALGLLAWSVGLASLREAISLYFLSTGLVFQGMTNTPWAEPGSFWTWSYRLTPTVIIGITAAALYLRKAVSAAEEMRLGQVLGMAAAAVPLAMLMLFRSDSPHLIGPSTALAPLVVLAVAHLPGRFAWRLDRGSAIRLGLIALFIAVYLPNPGANLRARIDNDRTFSDPRRIGSPGATIEGLRLLIGASPAEAVADPVVRKLGFMPAMDHRCCYNNEWSFGEWSAAMRQINAVVAGRSTFVDTKLPIESSGVYFLADLRVGTPYVSRIMSIWTDDDLRDVGAALARARPECVVMGEPGSALGQGVIASYPSATVTKIPGRLGLTVTCAAAPR